MEDEQEFPQDDAIGQLLMELQPTGQWNDNFANPNDLVFNVKPEPSITLDGIEKCLKTKLFFTEQETQQFMNSPEYVTYIKLTSLTYSPLSTLRAFIVKNYKPFVKSTARALHSRGYDGTHYIHYDGQMLDEFFANENILQTIENIGNVNLRDMLKYYLYATTYGIILMNNINHHRDEMRDFINNKELAHVFFCTYQIYFSFCKNHELQRRAIISTIHENANQTSTTCNAIRMFADEYIVSKILNFF